MNCGATMVFVKDSSLVRCHSCASVTQMQSNTPAMGAPRSAPAPRQAPTPTPTPASAGLRGVQGVWNNLHSNIQNNLQNNRWGFGGQRAPPNPQQDQQARPENVAYQYEGGEVEFNAEQTSLTKCGQCQTTIRIPNVLTYFSCTNCNAILQNPNATA